MRPISVRGPVACTRATPAPAGDERPRVEEREVLAARSRERRAPVPERLAHGDRLARHERLVDGDVAPLHERGVRRHAVPLGEHDEVVAHELAARDAEARAVAKDEGPRARQVAQRGERALRLPLLEEREHYDEENEAEQHRGFLPMANRRVDGAARDEQQRHRLAHEGEGALHRTAARSRELIQPFLGATRGDLGSGEAPERLDERGHRSGHRTPARCKKCSRSPCA